MRNFLHEWRMRRKIKAILAYNKKHPEECFNLGNYVVKEGIQPGQGNLLAQDIQSALERLKADSVQGIHTSLLGGDSNG